MELGFDEGDSMSIHYLSLLHLLHLFRLLGVCSVCFFCSFCFCLLLLLLSAPQLLRLTSAAALALLGSKRLQTAPTTMQPGFDISPQLP